MSSDNAIELFNCSICSFCETSLDRLVKHIRSHIKPEPFADRCVEKKTTVDLSETQHPKSSSESDSKQSSGFYEKHMRYMSEERTSITSTVESHVAPPAVISTSHTGLLTVKNNIQIQPKPPTNTSPFLMVNSNRREQPGQFHNFYRAPMYAENNVPLQPHKNLYHQQNQFSMKPPPRYNTPAKNPPHQFQRASEQAMYHEHQRPPPYEREFVGHYGKDVIQPPRQNNTIDHYRRNHPERSNENHRHLSNFRNNADQRKEILPMPKELMMPRNTMQMKRPLSGQPHNEAQLMNRIHSPVSPNKRQALSNQISSIQPDLRTLDNNIVIPNQANVYLNPNQLLQAAGQLPFDKLSGVLLVPLKNTAEVATQADDLKNETHKELVSCQVQTDLKMGNLLESQSPQNISSTGHIRSLEDIIECPVCANEFHNQQRLKEHMSTFHTIICQKCSFSSTNINEYNVHKEECYSKDEILCLECNNAFNSVRKLNIHRQGEHKVRMSYRCGICNAPFEMHGSVMKHIMTHDYSISQFKCNYAPCNKIFESIDALNIHSAKHKTMTVMHECRFCNLTFASAHLLRNHIGDTHVLPNHDEPNKTNHQKNEIPTSFSKSSSPVEQEKRIFLCDHCQLAFRNKFFLKKHDDMCSKNLNVQQTEYICDVCNEFFQNEQLKIDHMKIDHRRENGNRCPKCSKSYRTWFKLKNHTIQQHSKKTCRECSTVFTKDPDLRKHEEEVHGKALTQPGERVYKCSICDATLFTLTDLMTHRKEQHSNVLQSKNSLKNNQDKYNQGCPSSKELDSMLDEEQAYQCYNEESFIESDDAVSGNDNELSVETCPQCNSIFTSKQDLQGHMSTVHGEANLPFQNNSSSKLKCNRCNKYFDDKRRLKNHLGLIHGQRPFECKICHKKFQYSSQVFWHMKKQHRSTVKGSVKTMTAKTKLSAYTNSSNSSAKYTEFNCDKCPKVFHTKIMLQSHKRLAHVDSYNYSNSNFNYSAVDNSDDVNTQSNFCATANDYKCHICDAAFQQLEKYQEHMSSHVGKEINGPSYLNENLPSMVTLNGGVYDNQDKQESDFDDDDSIMGESQHHHNEPNFQHDLLKGEPVFDVSLGEYICPICQKTTKSITGMKTHYGRVHRFWSKETTHKDDVVQLKIWQCKSCDREFGQFQNLLDHSQSIHGHSITENEAEMNVRYETKTRSSSMKYNYACPHCDVSFDNSKAIRVHTFKKHGVLLNESDLLLWRSDRTNESEINTIVSKPKIELPDIRFKCQLCMSKFVSTKAIRIHSFKRHGIVLMKREVMKCKMSIKKPVVTDSFLSRHRGKDLIEEPHPCEECGRVFGNYRALFTHYRQAHRAINATKVPKKPSRTEISANFPANRTSPFTPKETPAPSFVQKHETTNFTESPSMVKTNAPESETASKDTNSQEPVPTIQCPKCDRIFTQRKSLMTHMYSAHHITKNNYHLFWPNGMPELPRKSSQCPTCGKVCIDERAVRIHIFKAHGVRYQDLINQNKKINEKEVKPSPIIEKQSTPLECIVCSKQFRRRQALILHELKAHRIKWSGSKRVLTAKMKFTEKVNTTDNHQENFFSNDGKNQKEIPRVDESNGFVCPVCNAFYANRRAITTHLCRIHRFTRDDLHAYLEDKCSIIETQPSAENKGLEQNSTTSQLDISENSTSIELNDRIEAEPIANAVTPLSGEADNPVEHSNVRIEEEKVLDENTETETCPAESIIEKKVSVLHQQVAYSNESHSEEMNVDSNEIKSEHDFSNGFAEPQPAQNNQYLDANFASVI